MSHGAQLPNVKEHAQAVVEAARMRMIGLTDMAIDAIEDLVENATSDAVRLKAATEVLDRAGIKGAPDLQIVVENRQSAAEIIAERLASMSKRMEADKKREAETMEDLGEQGEIDDAEIVVDDTPVPV